MEDRRRTTNLLNPVPKPPAEVWAASDRFASQERRAVAAGLVCALGIVFESTPVAYYVVFQLPRELAAFVALIGIVEIAVEVVPDFGAVVRIPFLKKKMFRLLNIILCYTQDYKRPIENG